MSEIRKIDRIKGLFGPLAVYKDSAQDAAFYVGPAGFLESALFQDRLDFRTQFKVIKIICRTIFTAGHAYRLFPDSEVPEFLSALSAEDAKLTEIVSVGERAINWEHEKLRNIVGVDQYQHVSSECLAEKDRELSTCFLIRGVKQLMFDLPREVYLLEVRTRVAPEDPNYDVNYHDLPPGLIPLLPSFKSLHHHSDPKSKNSHSIE